jgi:hypothetical protein
MFNGWKTFILWVYLLFFYKRNPEKYFPRTTLKENGDEDVRQN